MHGFFSFLFLLLFFSFFSYFSVVLSFFLSVRYFSFISLFPSFIYFHFPSYFSSAAFSLNSWRHEGSRHTLTHSAPRHAHIFDKLFVGILIFSRGRWLNAPGGSVTFLPCRDCEKALINTPIDLLFDLWKSLRMPTLPRLPKTL